MRSVISSAIDPRARAVPRLCRNAGDEDLLGLSTIIDIVHQEGEQLVLRNVSETARSWMERPRPSWPCSAPLLPTPTP